MIIIQARMGSKRFEGKSLFRFRLRPVLGHLIDSLHQIQGIKPTQIWVATSDQPQDDAIAKFAVSEGVMVYRGDEKNVASRFFAILNEKEPDFFTRINGDSPLMDHRLINESWALFREYLPDLVSTVPGRKFPSGMNVETLKTKVFMSHYPKFQGDDHEHITQYFYNHPEAFKIHPMTIPMTEDDAVFKDCKFSFDTSEDKKRLQNLFSALEKPHYAYTLKEKCRLYNKLFGTE